MFYTLTYYKYSLLFPCFFSSRTFYYTICGYLSQFSYFIISLQICQSCVSGFHTFFSHFLHFSPFFIHCYVLTMQKKRCVSFENTPFYFFTFFFFYLLHMYFPLSILLDALPVPLLLQFLGCF